VVWYMRGVVHVDPGTFAGRAPPLDMGGVCELNADVNSDATRRHIAILSDSCPLFTSGISCSIIISRPCIRAPPIPALYSS
jgi:hypothetical protein